MRRNRKQYVLIKDFNTFMYIVEENIFAIVVWKILEQISLIGHVKDYFKMDGKIMIKMAKKM